MENMTYYKMTFSTLSKEKQNRREHGGGPEGVEDRRQPVTLLLITSSTNWQGFIYIRNRGLFMSLRSIKTEICYIHPHQANMPTCM